MILYYEKDGKAKIEIYNGLLELKKALKGETPFDEAETIALRSGELFIGNIAGKEALKNFCSETAMEIQASNMIEVYFAPSEGFISKDVMTARIKNTLSQVDDDTCEMIMFSMYPDAFFGKFTVELLDKEIEDAYKEVLIQLEEEAAND